MVGSHFELCISHQQVQRFLCKKCMCSCYLRILRTRKHTLRTIREVHLQPIHLDTPQYSHRIHISKCQQHIKHRPHTQGPKLLRSHTQCSLQDKQHTQGDLFQIFVFQLGIQVRRFCLEEFLKVLTLQGMLDIHARRIYYTKQDS